MATAKTETPETSVAPVAPSAVDNVIKSLDALVKANPKTAGAIGGGIVTGIAVWFVS